MPSEKEDIQEFLTAFGKRVKELRKERGMTQVELEAKSGLDVRQIQRIEAGDVNFTIETLLRLAKGFIIDLAKLLELNDL
ncbi:MAG: helix-turn-helix transcriptional regulator [Bacteroidota bacterium]